MGRNSINPLAFKNEDTFNNNDDSNRVLISDSETDRRGSVNSISRIVNNPDENCVLTSDSASDSKSSSSNSSTNYTGSGSSRGSCSDSTEPTSAKLSIIPRKNGEEELDLKLDDILKSSLNNFIVIEFLGSGAFGKVIKCRKESTGECVAVKILRMNSRFTQEGDREIKLLHHLNENNAYQHNIVRFYENFEYQTHKCLVFEAMEQSLRDHLENTQYKPLALPFVRTITSQLLVALVHLKNLGILHNDIKPDNIMLVNSELFPYRIKLIDFGSACHISNINRNKPYIQTRWYRAPEIILGLPFSASIDVWSLGCVMAELFTGSPLYCGNSEYDMIRLITQAQGFLPGSVLNLALKADKFFVSYNVAGSSRPIWRLKTRQEVEPEAKSNETMTYNMGFLRSLVKYNMPNDLFSNDIQGEIKDREAFLDILENLLMIEEGRRITAQAAQDHPFLTLAHLTESTYADRYKQSQLALTNSQPQRSARARKGVIRSQARAQNTNSVTLRPQNDLARNNLIPGQSNAVHVASNIGRNKRQCESDLDILPPVKRQNLGESPAE